MKINTLNAGSIGQMAETITNEKPVTINQNNNKELLDFFGSINLNKFEKDAFTQAITKIKESNDNSEKKEAENYFKDFYIKHKKAIIKWGGIGFTALLASQGITLPPEILNLIEL